MINKAVKHGKCNKIIYNRNGSMYICYLVKVKVLDLDLLL